LTTDDHRRPQTTTDDHSTSITEEMLGYDSRQQSVPQGRAECLK
jgi:hypothetical protein